MTRGIVKDWETENVFRDLLFRIPDLKNNEWFSFLYRNFTEAEDEGERAPPLAEIFKDVPAVKLRMNGPSTRISMVDIQDRPRFIIRRYEDGQ